MSCSIWPAATRTFLGVQPRFGQVPPRSSGSLIATESPARRTGPVTPIPAVPPPRMTTSNVWHTIGPSLFGGDGGRDGLDDHGRHLELRLAIPDVVALCDPVEIR